MAEIRGITPITNRRVGRLIALERNRRYLSLAELGTRVGVDHSTLSGWEHGKRPVPKKHVPALSRELELDPELIDPEAA